MLSANDVTDITVTGREYNWNMGYNEFTFDCKILGEPEKLRLHIQRHDDGEGVIIYDSKNNDILDRGMDINEVWKLEHTLSLEANFDKWHTDIEGAGTKDDLDNILFSFMEEDNSLTNENGKRIQSELSKKYKSLILEDISEISGKLHLAIKDRDKDKIVEGHNSLISIYNENEDVLLTGNDVLAIYQINAENHRNYAFESISNLRKFGVIPDNIDGTLAVTRDKYNLIYVEELKGRTLEEVFNDFNFHCPEDFHGHSMSVSDVIAITDKENGKMKSFYVDSFGFEELPNFFHEIDLEREMKNLHSLYEYDAITEKCFTPIYDGELDDTLNKFDIKDTVMEHIKAVLDDAELNDTVKITNIAIHGSRSRGLEKPQNESDLDILIEYEGDYPEDGLFNVLHDFEPDYQIAGVKVDITPINKADRTIGEYLEEEEKYHEDKIKAALENGEYIAVSGYYLEETGSTADLFPKEIADIVEGQLEGYGYASGKLFGELVKVDMEYSHNGQVEIIKTTPEELLNDAIEYRTELMDEKYSEESKYDLQDESVQELIKMETFRNSYDKEHTVKIGDMKEQAEKKKEMIPAPESGIKKNKEQDNTIG